MPPLSPASSPHDCNSLSLPDAALAYVQLGWRIFPLRPGDKRPLAALAANGFKDSTTDEEQVRVWWAQTPDANIGIATGPGSGLLAIDVDAYKERVTDDPAFRGPTTLKVFSAHGGLHFYYQYPDSSGLTIGEGKPRKGWDFRGEGGYIVAPPSRLADAEQPYQWTTLSLPALASREALQARLLPPGQDWLDAVTAPATPASPSPSALAGDLPQRAPEQLTELADHFLQRAIEQTVEGTRSHFCQWLSCQLRDNRVDVEVAKRVVTDFALAVANIGKPDYFPKDAIGTLLSAYRTPPREPTTFGRADEADSSDPSDPLLPPGYAATPDEGLCKVARGEDGKRVHTRIARVQELRIRGRITDVTAHTEWLRLAWRRDAPGHQGQRRETVAERQVVMNTRDIVKLAECGFPVTSLNARDLVAYLDAYEDHNRARLPVERVSPQLGWHDHHATFLWGHEALTAPADREEQVQEQEHEPEPEPGATDRLQFRANSQGDGQLADACRSSGTVEEWITAVTPIRDYPTVQFGLYAALTAPLLRVLDVPNFVVDFSGRTSTGKTTALRVAASVAGNPDERASASLVGSWDTTRVAIERRCATSTDLPVFLDDTKRAKKADEVGTILYEVANGKGRDRGNLAGRERTSSWHTVVLSTGEAPATSFTQDGGTHGRVLSFNGPPFTRSRGDGGDDMGLDATASLVERLGSGVRRHYGHALPLLVRFVQAHRDEWPQWREAYEAMRDALHATNEVACRLTAYFAAVQFTATLTHRAFAEAGHPLPWEPDLGGLWGAIAASTDEANTDVRALQEVYPWAASRENDFYRPSMTTLNGKRAIYESPGAVAPRTGWLGRWETGADWTEIAFLPDKVRDYLDGAGFRFQEVFNGWKERGWLRLDPDGKLPKVRLTSETRPRLVVVLRRAFVAVGAVDANAWDSAQAQQNAAQAELAADDAALARQEERGVAVRIPPPGYRVSKGQLVRLLDLDYPWEEVVRLTEAQARHRIAKREVFHPPVDDEDGNVLDYRHRNAA